MVSSRYTLSESTGSLAEHFQGLLMMKNRLYFPLAMALFGASGVVAADSPATGFYVGAGIGKAYADLDEGDVTQPLANAGFAIAGSSKEDDATSWRLFFGLRINPYLALEATWLDLGEYEIKTDIGGGNPGHLRSTLDAGSTFNLGLVAGYPFTDRVHGFAKLGAVVWSADVESRAYLASGSAISKDDDSGTDLSFGLGVGVDLTEQIAVRGDWDRYQFGGKVDTDIDVWSVGIQYRF